MIMYMLNSDRHPDIVYFNCSPRKSKEIILRLFNDAASPADILRV
jgi:hypothetical protein